MLSKSGQRKMATLELTLILTLTPTTTPMSSPTPTDTSMSTLTEATPPTTMSTFTRRQWEASHGVDILRLAAGVPGVALGTLAGHAWWRARLGGRNDESARRS